MNLAVLLVLVTATLYLLWKVLALTFSLIDFWKAEAAEEASRNRKPMRGKVRS